MVSVTPLWGVNDKIFVSPTVQRLIIVGEWPHLCLVGTMRWTKIDVSLVHYLFYGQGYNRNYQLPLIPRSSNFGMITGIWSFFFLIIIFYLFYFFTIMALKVPLPALISQ